MNTIKDDETDNVETRKNEQAFEEHELEEIESRAPARAPVIFETIRRKGDEELARPVVSLAASGLLAGIALGLSVMAQALLRAHLPDTEWRPLVDNFGYSIGFLLVVLGQLQLFTENTITAVCPVLDAPRPKIFFRVVRLWTVVFASNVVGAAIFGYILYATQGMQPKVWEAITEISMHSLDHSWLETMTRGIGAGWLIAILVWIMPNSEGSKPLMIIIVTYLIGLAGFTHVIAGTTEAAVVAWSTPQTGLDVAWSFVLPAFIGNLLGGTVFFTFLTWAQIRAELYERRNGKDGERG